MLSWISLSVLLVGCHSKQQLKDEVADLLLEHPELVTKSIEKNPLQYVEAFQGAVKSAQKELADKKRLDEKRRFEESFANPLKPSIRSDEAMMGSADAPLVLVEYSDFQCPFCKKAKETVTSLRSQYKGRIVWIYKHLPLSFHPQAMISAQFFEALRRQDPKLAFAFHDQLFANQSKLRNGEKFLMNVAKDVGANMTKLKKDVHSKEVIERIKEDMKEAQKFGLNGTPGFLLNGIAVRGAYPLSHFQKIISELKKRQMVVL